MATTSVAAAAIDESLMAGFRFHFNDSLKKKLLRYFGLNLINSLAE